MDPRLEVDSDFILIKRFGFSLSRLLERYPDGAPDEIIAQALGIPLIEVEPLYQSIVLKLRKKLQDNEPCESIVD